MGTAGLIYAAIAAAWLAYLIPTFLRRKEEATAEQADPNDRFSDSVRIIRSGNAPLLDQDLTEMSGAEVSTPLTRRAAIRELRRLESVAAGRRRRVLLALMILVSMVAGVWAAGLVPWWTMLIPGGLVVGFFVLSRFSVAAMRRDLDARYAEIRGGSDESTVLLNRRQVADAITGAGEDKPNRKPAGLWDPLPITMPTYVSKPLAPRTVRTIDLSAPEMSVPVRPDAPVTADRPAPEPVSQPDEVVGVVNPPVADEAAADGDVASDQHHRQASGQ